MDPVQGYSQKASLTASKRHGSDWWNGATAAAAVIPAGAVGEMLGAVLSPLDPTAGALAVQAAAVMVPKVEPACLTEAPTDGGALGRGVAANTAHLDGLEKRRRYRLVIPVDSPTITEADAYQILEEVLPLVNYADLAPSFDLISGSNNSVNVITPLPDTMVGSAMVEADVFMKAFTSFGCFFPPSRAKAGLSLLSGTAVSGMKGEELVRRCTAAGALNIMTMDVPPCVTSSADSSVVRGGVGRARLCKGRCRRGFIPLLLAGDDRVGLMAQRAMEFKANEETWRNGREICKEYGGYCMVVEQGGVRQSGDELRFAPRMRYLKHGFWKGSKGPAIAGEKQNKYMISSADTLNGQCPGIPHASMKVMEKGIAESRSCDCEVCRETGGFTPPPGCDMERNTSIIQIASCLSSFVRTLSGRWGQEPRAPADAPRAHRTRSKYRTPRKVPETVSQILYPWRPHHTPTASAAAKFAHCFGGVRLGTNSIKVTQGSGDVEGRKANFVTIEVEVVDRADKIRKSRDFVERNIRSRLSRIDRALPITSLLPAGTGCDDLLADVLKGTLCEVPTAWSVTDLHVRHALNTRHAEKVIGHLYAGAGPELQRKMCSMRSEHPSSQSLIVRPTDTRSPGEAVPESTSGLSRHRRKRLLATARNVAAFEWAQNLHGCSAAASSYRGPRFPVEVPFPDGHHWLHFQLNRTVAREREDRERGRGADLRCRRRLIRTEGCDVCDAESLLKGAKANKCFLVRFSFSPGVGLIPVLSVFNAAAVRRFDHLALAWSPGDPMRGWACHFLGEHPTPSDTTAGQEDWHGRAESKSLFEWRGLKRGKLNAERLLRRISGRSQRMRQPIEAKDWFFGNIPPDMAERIVKFSPSLGAFMISQLPKPGDYRLTVKRPCGCVKHYRITQGGGRYYIFRRATFPSLLELVSYYRQSQGGLFTKLGQPAKVLSAGPEDRCFDPWLADWLALRETSQRAAKERWKVLAKNQREMCVERWGPRLGSKAGLEDLVAYLESSGVVCVRPTSGAGQHNTARSPPEAAETRQRTSLGARIRAVWPRRLRRRGGSDNEESLLGKQKTGVIFPNDLPGHYCCGKGRWRCPTCNSS